MFKKIILPVVLLIFTHQEFYGMYNNEYNIHNKNTGYKTDVKQQAMNIWETLDSYCNTERDETKKKLYPRLWLLWSIVDNVPFQYGNSKKISKQGEAYYGLSNGMGSFPSFLNFGWLKIGILDSHINVINAVINYIKIYVERKVYYSKNIVNNCLPIWLYSFIDCFFVSVVITGIHLLSFNFFNCVKIKIISIGAVAFCMSGEVQTATSIDDRWYLTFSIYKSLKVPINFTYTSFLYLILSPRIEINISGIINYFNEK